MSNAFTIAKLLPLLILIVAGSWYLFSTHQAVAPRLVSASATTWLDTMLLLVFAYGGYETALTPMAEATNPRRDSAFAVLAAILCCVLVYALIQWVAVGVLPNLAASGRPLAEVARRVFGDWGAGLTTVAALVALYGYLSANMLGVPRITYAMAEGGDLPAVFASVHERFRTPHVSIVLFAFLTWALALAGSFAWNVTLSSVARLFYYAAVCISLVVLRRKQVEPASFSLPGGNVLAMVGIGICVVLITRVDRSGMLILLATITLAALNWLWVRSREAGVQT
jgi:amino acid transporter